MFLPPCVRGASSGLEFSAPTVGEQPDGLSGGGVQSVLTVCEDACARAQQGVDPVSGHLFLLFV